MEQPIQNQEAPLFGLTIDQAIKFHLSETARWARFLAIVGFVMCILVVVAGIMIVSSFDKMDRSVSSEMGPSFSSTFGSAMIVFYILIAILYFFPCLFLLRFSSKMRAALATDNQIDLTLSFQNLKILFRYVGILTIIILALYLLAILFGGLGMMMSR